MDCVCKFDPKRDIKKVVPNGALDLKAAFANNAVPATLQSSESAYNQIDDPSSIAGRVKDRIDAEVAAKNIRDYKAPNNSQ